MTTTTTTTTTTDFRGAALGGGEFNIDIGTEMANPVSAALSGGKAVSRGPGGGGSYEEGVIEGAENVEDERGNGKEKGEGEREKKAEVKDSSDDAEEHARNDELQRRREQKEQQVQKLSDRELMRRYQARKMRRAYHAARADYEKKRYVSCRARALLLLRNPQLRPEMRVLTLHLVGVCSYYGLARLSFETALSVCGKLDDDVDPQGVLRSDTLALLEELELYRPVEGEGEGRGGLKEKGKLWIEVFERDS
ncbi:uncharacterized protein L3040_000335 [Drepanopeziza brunnea f. sp. 'multigermtubi']|uniref:uncharacterized protein n=1 Tax=Drepanopeziza brunnea f. sp. 'multigermtubi' TaxID=698441 RepID=UPI0023A7707D|nr:hypothetical protein L3040_000335 [Drepanopeziza brunnea f. sp. 'multigermtubi']